MAIEKRSQGISKVTKQLLASGETEAVDYKKNPSGISAEDFVSFANADGGQILVGVAETTQDGAQTGMVCGCDVGDGTMLQVINKASSCIPPVAIDIFIENLTDKPLLRLVIRPSETKPHCTPKGVYSIREGTRARALHPAELLALFLEAEASSFAEKFEAAADRITQDLTELERSLDQSIANMADQLGWADLKLGDTESTIDTILAYVRRLMDETDDANQRLRTLFEQDERKDPIRERERKDFIDRIVDQVEGEAKLKAAILAGTNLPVTARGKAAMELSTEELRSALAEAYEKVRRRDDLRKYSREVKKPSDCSKEEIDQFVSLVSQGGEVSKGVRERIGLARALGFVKYDDLPVGVAAIKSPLKSYKKKVFALAKADEDIDRYTIELGWIYLKENHRKKGQITPLLEKLLADNEGASIFATTRSSITVMRELLAQFGFERRGQPYPSVEHPDEMLELFVKSSGRDR